MLELGVEEDPEVECLGALLLELDDEGKQDEVDELALSPLLYLFPPPPKKKKRNYVLRKAQMN